MTDCVALLLAAFSMIAVLVAAIGFCALCGAPMAGADRGPPANTSAPDRRNIA